MEHYSDDYSESEDAHEASQVQDQDKAGGSTPTGPTPKLSCDICRHRKVRCDRREPCSRCIRMNMPCSYTAVPRPRPKRAKVLVTNQYEAKIDEISRKIDAICRIVSKESHLSAPLESLADQITGHMTPMSNATTSSPQTAAPEPRAVPPSGRPRNGPLDALRSPEPEHEGESALSAHTVFATRFLRDAVTGDPSTPVPLETESVLDQLRHDAGKLTLDGEGEYGQLPYAKGHSRAPSGSGMPLPPSHLSFAVLRMLREYPRVKYFWAFEIESVEQFSEYFFTVYSSHNASAADRIIVYIGLFWLFSECVFVVADEQLKDEYRKQAELCRGCLETLLAGLPFHLPPSFDWVLAFAMAATYGVEQCRPTLAWNYIGAAVRMSQALGFGKPVSQSFDPVTERRKNRLLATIYMHDQMLSLRLGRPSAMGGYTLPMDEAQWLAEVNTVELKIMPRWIGVARIQGRIYDWLYSPAAMAQPVTVRAEKAVILLGELHRVQRVQSERCEVEKKWKRNLAEAAGEDMLKLMNQSEDVSELALNCMIHRNIPAADGSGAPFSDECISYARQAMVKHRECMAAVCVHQKDSMEIYMNWALLACPFVPFIVLLCNVVQTYNLGDLELLGDMINSIDSTRDALPAVSRQLRLFRPLYEVASRYVEAKAHAASQSVGFDAFLEEMNMDVDFQSTLMSTLQGRPYEPAHAHAGHAPDANGSILDLWSFLDSPQNQ